MSGYNDESLAMKVSVSDLLEGKLCLVSGESKVSVPATEEEIASLRDYVQHHTPFPDGMVCETVMNINKGTLRLCPESLSLTYRNREFQAQYWVSDPPVACSAQCLPFELAVLSVLCDEPIVMHIYFVHEVEQESDDTIRLEDLLVRSGVNL